ncbi:MAG: PDZ domain-containing protein, partial [Candidatus Kapaibacterium sp.]
EGVLVQDVLKDSPAKNAGIESGDVLLELNGTPLSSSNQLQSLVVIRKPGERIKLKVFRDGKTIMKDVVLQARDSKDLSSADKGSKGDTDTDESVNSPVSLELLGFSVGPLTEDAKQKSDVSSGVLITKVSSYSEAANQGLQPKQIIVSADRKAITTTQQLKKIIESKNPGDVVLLKVKNQDRTAIISLEIPEKKK